MTSSKLKKSDQHKHDMTQIEGGHVDYRDGAVPGPDSVNRRVSGPGTEPGTVPGLARLKWAICKRGYRVLINVGPILDVAVMGHFVGGFSRDVQPEV